MKNYTRKEKEQMYEDALTYWGEMAQFDQTIEEMAELMLAINKMKRKKFYGEYSDNDSIEENYIEEICDVKLCLDQLIYMFKDNKRIEDKENYKYSKFEGQIVKQKERANKK